MGAIVPPKTVFRATDEAFLRSRAEELHYCLAVVAASPIAWQSYPMAMCEFCEVSHYSFSHALGRKGKEGYIRMHSGGRLLGSSIIRAEQLPGVSDLFWTRQWVTLKDNAIIFADSPLSKPRGILPVDRMLEVDIDKSSYISVKGSGRTLRLWTGSQDELFRWIRGFCLMYGRRITVDPTIVGRTATVLARTGGDIPIETLFGNLFGTPTVNRDGVGRIRLKSGTGTATGEGCPDEQRHSCPRLWRRHRFPLVSPPARGG